jgi:ATP-dependent RNA helicase DeaD
VWVAQQQLKIAEWDGVEAPQSGNASRPPQRSFRPQGARPGGHGGAGGPPGGGKPPRKKRDY